MSCGSRPNDLGEGDARGNRVDRVSYDGSQRQPSLSSQVITFPSPAIPDIPWSSSRQYSPGS